jgi:hypothetical protein
MLRELRSFVAVCEELLQLSVREHHALKGAQPFQPEEFCQVRKDLLTRLNQVLIALKHWRQAGQAPPPAERPRHPEVKALLEVLQPMIVKILQLDRENQQALLRQGLLPARHGPEFAAQHPSFVTKLYARHTGA